MTTKTERKQTEEMTPLMALFWTFMLKVSPYLFAYSMYRYLIVLVVRNIIVRRTHNPGIARLKGSSKTLSRKR